MARCPAGSSRAAPISGALTLRRLHPGAVPVSWTSRCFLHEHERTKTVDQDQQLRCALDLVRAMSGSMSSDQIRRIEWWSRIKSALEAAAQSADSFGSLVSTMATKLQIDVTTIEAGERIADLARRVDDVPAFIRYCDCEALYIVALAQAESQERRAAPNASKTAATSSTTTAPPTFNPRSDTCT